MAGKVCFSEGMLDVCDHGLGNCWIALPPFATTTSSLDLCPLPHLNLQGHKVEMSEARPSMVISLKLYLFHISDLFLK